MACSACEKRRRTLQALKDKKKAKGQQIQASAIGAVLAVTDMAGKVLGINGEVADDNGRQDQGGSQGAG